MAKAQDTPARPRRSGISGLAKLSLALVSMGAVALAFEGCLQVAVSLGVARSYVSLYGDAPQDERLVWQLPPNAYVDVDEKGYRNPSVPERADIVAIGDSQTYGLNALSHESWPMQLGELTGKSVYSIAIGGWGPVQYRAVLDDALALEPEMVLFGFYMGNDLHDACSAAGTHYWRDRLAAPQLDLSPCIASVDSRPPAADPGWRALVRQSEVLMRLKQVPLVSALVSVRRDLRIAERDPANYFVVRQPKLETIVMLGPRLAALDPQEPMVQSGTAIAKHLYDQVSHRIPSDRWGIVFISTKAGILYDHLLAAGAEMPANFHRLVETQRATIADMQAFFQARGVRSVDTTAAMASLVGGDEPIFLPYFDGHPTALGYRRIAEAALPLVR